MRIKFFYLVSLAICSVNPVLAQKDSTYNELEHLSGLVHQFVYKHDTVNNNRHSEFAILFVGVNDSGNIASIDLMADEKNSGNTVAILKNILPESLSEWQSKNNKRKLIIVPVYCSGSKSSSYLDQLSYSPLIPSDQCGIKSNKDFVIAPQVFYIGPNTTKSQ